MPEMIEVPIYAILLTSFGKLIEQTAYNCRELYDCWKRSCLLSYLPGPKIPFVQGMAAFMEERKDHHRLLSEWAEEYGSVYRNRFLMFHVRADSVKS